jgi:hypothetical protein
MTYTEELRDVIRRLHGVDSTHVESVPIKETFQGKTVWEGIVEVFELHGHPKASKLYAWAYETDNPKKPQARDSAASRPDYVAASGGEGRNCRGV